MIVIEILNKIRHCGYAFCGYKATEKSTSRRKIGGVALPYQDSVDY